MYDLATMWAWFDFAVRWTHVITGIAWIGSSFYFIALDLGLRKAADMPKGVSGEEWQVHGGGFYHIRKYMVAPEVMPEHLTWFKWEAYSTWLSGAALLMIVYWAGAEFFLIDPNKLDLATWQAVLISAGSLAIGWLVYDWLCRSWLGHSPTTLMLLLFVLLVVMAWGYDQIFTGRAALLHLGAFTATIMSANVFFTIIPNQKIVVEDLKAGRTPDPDYGRVAKLRSTHNNYLTLPVLFLMLSNHYPLAFASDYNWLIASLVFLMGVTIRHWFNQRHAGAGSPYWTWPATALLFITIMGLSTAPLYSQAEQETAMRPLTSIEDRMAKAEGFQEVQDIVLGRCAMCHAREPAWQGLLRPPKGVVLETEADIARAADQIYLQAGVTDAMPPANLTAMEDGERLKIAAWYQNVKESLP
jgi:uncharacterized membrane protein